MDAATAELSELESVLAGDLGVILAQVTPLKGVVLTPVNNFGWDPATRTATFTSDLAAFKKLQRLQRNPKLSLVFHAREHGTGSGNQYVVVQGDAEFSWETDRDALAALFTGWWERSNGDGRRSATLTPEDLGGFFWDWWLAPFFWDRVIVRVRAQRIIAFPDLDCRGAPTVIGREWDAQPAESQKPPAKGTGPRVSGARAARMFNAQPHRLLGWVGTDGYPVVAPATVTGTGKDGRLALSVPEQLAPTGQRRAGLTGHWFAEGTIGQRQIVMTGWLSRESSGDLLYAPHTRLSYRMPPSRWMWRTVGGLVVRVGIWRAGRSGVPVEAGASA
ncbi:pyridoxamine 5'-phosphate oxidase family protein [Jongsikchunia kroppenstedtii]|uniref:pyridoxamine 5'-phosphate oxidase family protein n=1 Tax=Jongsikchunia kroppenstedtii TaxID=1121721 RepID=UPI00037DD17C|nr:pyridoxamine 5'-phosphate oxidase family protein [Jongsikchunia kroppenstedtii]